MTSAILSTFKEHDPQAVQTRDHFAHLRRLKLWGLVLRHGSVDCRLEVTTVILVSGGAAKGEAPESTYPFPRVLSDGASEFSLRKAKQKQPGQRSKQGAAMWVFDLLDANESEQWFDLSSSRGTGVHEAKTGSEPLCK